MTALYNFILHGYALAKAHPQTDIIIGLTALWLLEQWLAATKRVRANSAVQAAFNALFAWAKLRYPLVVRLGNLADQLSIEVKTVEKTTTATTTIDATPAESPSARTKQTLSMLLPFLFVSALVAGCSPTAAYVTALKVQAGAAQSFDTTADAWHQYSHARLESILDASKSLADYQTKSQAWEVTVVKVDAQLANVRDAIKLYADALAAAGAAQAKDLSAALSKLIQAAGKLQKELAAHGINISIPGVTL